MDGRQGPPSRSIPAPARASRPERWSHPAAVRPRPRPYSRLAVNSRYFGIRGSNTEPPTPAPNVVLLSAVPTIAVEPATHGPTTHLRVLSLKNRCSPYIS